MLLNSEHNIDQHAAEVNMISLLFNKSQCLSKHKSSIVLLYNKCMLCISCHFGPFKALTLRMDHAKLLDALMSLPVSHPILPRALQRNIQQTMQHVAILAALDRHLSQSEDVYL